MITASPLEALSAEILDSILENLIGHDIGTLRECDHVDCTSLSRLSQCSRFLNHRLEHLLYGTLDARNAALRNGCLTGNLHAVQKAASCGANPSVVQRYTLNNTVVHAEQATGYREVASFQLALKAGQLEAYNLLLDLGAGFTPDDYSNIAILNSQLKTFARKLAEPSNAAFLKAFVEARAETPYWKDGRRDNHSQALAVVKKIPFPHVVGWASPAILEMLLDNGASLDQVATLSHVDMTEKEQPLTPLSAACLRGDVEVFNLLVARGAHVDIEDSLRSKYPAKYTHIPILMAARRMGAEGSTNMLDACIAAGADVNRPCHMHVVPREDEHTQRETPHVCTTPLLEYLGSIKSWKIASSGSGKLHLTPYEGTTHFLYTLGANAPSPVVPLVKRVTSNPDRELRERTFGGFPSPIELLLAKWGIESLAIPEFFLVIKLLIEHGGSGPDLGRMLVRFEGQNETSGSNMVDVEGLWQKFLALLLPQLESLDQDSKNALLRRVIVDKAAMRHRVAHPSRWVKVRAIGRASIRALINAGADINDSVVACETYPNHLTKTALHRLISSFIHTDCLTEDFVHDHPQGHVCPYTTDVVESFGDFLDFLVKEGADPLIEDSSKYRGDERTAIDTLLSAIRGGRIKHERGTAENGLMNLVSRLQGASQIFDYTGDRKPYEEGSWWRRSRPSYNSLSDCELS
ncbi:hypothetical protein FB567DRAFT_515398 [Paraphoma chrysanthemicola]|uniref:Ankyrin n=1 Tax=Paraphoma chrysanthemicola TaxID=798071 RepID=A0A8K0W3M2_9PLEO|nr:hypothetical protein FB567DRAFT_515398 [Paraphoma chrysanthemicola]